MSLYSQTWLFCLLFSVSYLFPLSLILKMFNLLRLTKSANGFSLWRLWSYFRKRLLDKYTYTLVTFLNYKPLLSYCILPRGVHMHCRHAVSAHLFFRNFSFPPLFSCSPRLSLCLSLFLSLSLYLSLSLTLSTSLSLILFVLEIFLPHHFHCLSILCFFSFLSLFVPLSLFL